VQLRRGRLRSHVRAPAAGESPSGVLMRDPLERRLAAELGRARRHGRPLSVVSFDVDGLKEVNEVHGDGAGDRLLAVIGTLFYEASREHDLCGRIGDECVIVLPEEDRSGAAAFRDRVEERLPAVREQLGLTTPWGLTSGVATFPRDGGTVRELLEAADRDVRRQRSLRLQAS
jgi:diguanylate cyclase (GGDEF)-like protein